MNEWEGLQMPLLPERSEGGLSILQQPQHLLPGTDTGKVALGAHPLLLGREGAEGSSRLRTQRQNISLHEPPCCSGCQLFQQSILASFEKPMMNDGRDWVYEPQRQYKMSASHATEVALSKWAVTLEQKEMGLHLLSQCNPLRLI